MSAPPKPKISELGRTLTWHLNSALGWLEARVLPDVRPATLDRLARELVLLAGEQRGVGLEQQADHSGRVSTIPVPLTRQDLNEILVALEQMPETTLPGLGRDNLERRLRRQYDAIKPSWEEQGLTATAADVEDVYGLIPATPISMFALARACHELDPPMGRPTRMVALRQLQAAAGSGCRESAARATCRGPTRERRDRRPPRRRVLLHQGADGGRSGPSPLWRW